MKDKAVEVGPEVLLKHYFLRVPLTDPYMGPEGPPRDYVVGDGLGLIHMNVLYTVFDSSMIAGGALCAFFPHQCAGRGPADGPAAYPRLSFGHGSAS